MKRRILSLLMGVALIAGLGFGFGFASPRSASANVLFPHPCTLVNMYIIYLVNEEENFALAHEWALFASQNGCTITV